MTGHESYECSLTEALEVVFCSASTLCRKLNENGSKLGVTKLKKSWRIPVETLETLGALKAVTVSLILATIHRIRLRALRHSPHRVNESVSFLHTRIVCGRETHKTETMSESTITN